MIERKAFKLSGRQNELPQSTNSYLLRLFPPKASSARKYPCAANKIFPRRVVCSPLAQFYDKIKCLWANLWLQFTELGKYRRETTLDNFRKFFSSKNSVIVTFKISGGATNRIDSFIFSVLTRLVILLRMKCLMLPTTAWGIWQFILRLLKNIIGHK